MFSCARNKKTENTNEFNNLRQQIEFYDEKTAWTEEIEKGRLSNIIKTKNGISKNLKLSPLVIAAAVNDEQQSVFPVLDGFGSLDLSLIEPKLKNFIDKFSDSFMKNDSLEKYFTEENRISLILHNIRIDEIEREISDFFPSEESFEIPLFDKYIVGTPFVENDVYEVPVKFFSESFSITVMFYCKKISSEWKLEQIQINSWEMTK